MRIFDEAPIGTIAPSTRGGDWVKIKPGTWEKDGANFGLPGMGWTGKLIYPDSQGSNAMLLTDLKQMEGKTIERAVMNGCDDKLVIRFTDGSLISFESRQACDMTEIIIGDEISDYDLMSVGAITEYEFRLREARKLGGRRFK